jgi:hypothetical protein
MGSGGTRIKDSSINNGAIVFRLSQQTEIAPKLSIA